MWEKDMNMEDRVPSACSSTVNHMGLEQFPFILFYPWASWRLQLCSSLSPPIFCLWPLLSELFLHLALWVYKVSVCRLYCCWASCYSQEDIPSDDLLTAGLSTGKANSKGQQQTFPWNATWEQKTAESIRIIEQTHWHTWIMTECK